MKEGYNYLQKYENRSFFYVRSRFDYTVWTESIF